MMIAEFEAGASVDEIERAMRSLDIEFEWNGPEIQGYLRGSNTRCFFRSESKISDISAEGVQVDWRVGMTGTFHYRVSDHLLAMQEVFSLMKSFAATSSSRFVLSLHYELIFAVWDGEELRTSWERSSSRSVLQHFVTVLVV